MPSYDGKREEDERYVNGQLGDVEGFGRGAHCGGGWMGAVEGRGRWWLLVLVSVSQSLL